MSAYFVIHLLDLVHPVVAFTEKRCNILWAFGEGQGAGCPQQGNEPSRSTNIGEFVN